MIGEQETLDITRKDIANGQKTVSTGGTAEKVTTDTGVGTILIRALDGNSGTVYVGDSNVSSSNGLELASGEGVSIMVNDFSQIFIDVDTNGEGVSFFIVK